MFDDFKKTLSESSMAKCCTIMTGVVGATLFVTATVYLGIFAFNNPDPKACWVIRDLHVSGLNQAEVINYANTMNIDITEGYPLEMHKVLKAWFTWGFYAKAAMLAASALFIPMFWCNEKASVIMGSISLGLYAVNGLVWVAFGGIWRFSKAGSIAAGDKLERLFGTTDEEWELSIESATARNGYQIESGRFMKIYLLLVVWLLALAFLAVIVTALVLCCCNPSGKNENIFAGESIFGKAADKQMDNDYIVQENDDSEDDQEDIRRNNQSQKKNRQEQQQPQRQAIGGRRR